MYPKLSRKQQEINMSRSYMKAVFKHIDALGFNYLKRSDYVPKSKRNQKPLEINIKDFIDTKDIKSWLSNVCIKEENNG